MRVSVLFGLCIGVIVLTSLAVVALCLTKTQAGKIVGTRLRFNPLFEQNLSNNDRNVVGTEDFEINGQVLAEVFRTLYVAIYALDQAGIPVWPHGGTAVAIQRNGGVMFWDDDVDIGVRRCDFARAKEVLDAATARVGGRPGHMSTNPFSSLWKFRIGQHSQDLFMWTRRALPARSDDEARHARGVVLDAEDPLPPGHVAYWTMAPETRRTRNYFADQFMWEEELLPLRPRAARLAWVRMAMPADIMPSLRRAFGGFEQQVNMYNHSTRARLTLPPHKFLRHRTQVPTKVLTFGSFDLFHEGHDMLLRHADMLGTEVWVGVSSAEVNRFKGKPNEQSLQDRIARVSAHECVTGVFVEAEANYQAEYAVAHKAAIVCMGGDWTNRFEHVRSVAHVVYFARTPNVSSTQLRS